MNCQEVHNRLQEYLDQELDEERALEVYKHLLLCRGCGCHHRFEAALKQLLRTRYVREMVWTGEVVLP